MKRRGFLTALSAFGLAPAIPALPAASAPVAASFNGYQYGLAVFHARTRASITAADLVARLRVSPAVASGMMDKMIAQGYVRASAISAGTFQAVSRDLSLQYQKLKETENLRKLGAKITEHLDEKIDEIAQDALNDEAPPELIEEEQA